MNSRLQFWSFNHVQGDIINSKWPESRFAARHAEDMLNRRD